MAYRKYFPFQMNTALKDRIKSPIAPMVLNTFGIPTAAVQAGIPNTKTVEKVLRRNVTETRASPTMSANICCQLRALVHVYDGPTVVSVEHICQSQRLDGCGAEIADTVAYSDLVPWGTVGQSVCEPPCSWPSR